MCLIIYLFNVEDHYQGQCTVRGRSWSVNQKKNVFSFLFFLVNVMLSVGAGLAVSSYIPIQQEKSQKRHCRKRSCLCQRFVSQIGRSVFTVVMSGNLQDTHNIYLLFSAMK